MRSRLPFAPASTARAMNASGSSQNTSTLADGAPSFAGVSQPFFSGSPRNIGAPSISIPTTDPRFQSSVAPSARVYHASAAGASATASITDITGRLLDVTTLSSPENNA